MERHLCALQKKILGQVDLGKELEDKELCGHIYQVVDNYAKENTISLSQQSQMGRDLFNSFRKWDILQDLLEDPLVTEIMINGPSVIFVERQGKLFKSDKRFFSKEKLEDVIQQMVGSCNRIVNESVPIVDARLPDGSRVNIVLPPVALNGPVVTIRKFPKTPITMEKLLELQTIDEQTAVFLEKLVKAKYNIFISGGTGSGKTTFLNALSNFIPKEERVITLEDNAELRLQGLPNLVSLETRNPNIEGKGEITMEELFRSALRMRPNRIIVGEVRGEEAFSMMEAMSSGHPGSMSTGHANSPKDMLMRLETMIMMGKTIPLVAIQRKIASGVDVIVQMSRMPDGSRKVTEIVEVIGIKNRQIQVEKRISYVEGTNKKETSCGKWVKHGELTQQRKWMEAGYSCQ